MPEISSGIAEDSDLSHLAAYKKPRTMRGVSPRLTRLRARETERKEQEREVPMKILIFDRAG